MVVRCERDSGAAQKDASWASGMTAALVGWAVACIKGTREGRQGGSSGWRRGSTLAPRTGRVQTKPQRQHRQQEHLQAARVGHGVGQVRRSSLPRRAGPHPHHTQPSTARASLLPRTFPTHHRVRPASSRHARRLFHEQGRSDSPTRSAACPAHSVEATAGAGEEASMQATLYAGPGDGRRGGTCSSAASQAIRACASASPSRSARSAALASSRPGPARHTRLAHAGCGTACAGLRLRHAGWGVCR